MRTNRQNHRPLLGSLLLPLAMVLAVVGCGSNTNNQAASTDSSAAATAVAAAQADLAAGIKPLSSWTGPSSGQPIGHGKSIVALTLASSTGAFFNPALQEATQLTGWSLKIIPLDPTQLQSWVPALNNAIALKPDGIVAFVSDVASISNQLSEMKAQGTTFIGYQAGATPGPDPAVPGMFTDITPNSSQQGQYQADLAIIDSKGTARVVFADTMAGAIAHQKVLGAENQLKKICPTTCQSLEVNENTFGAYAGPAGGAALMTPWVEKYGSGSAPFYVITFSDVVYDNMVPTLSAAGIATGQVRLIGSDGRASAYQRIRSGEYQIGTIPQPYHLLAYQVVDEFNRAFHNAPASNWAPPTFMVDKSNVHAAGGDSNQYIPPFDYLAQYRKIWGLGG